MNSLEKWRLVIHKEKTECSQTYELLLLNFLKTNNLAPRPGISPSTKLFSSKKFVWAPPRYLVSLLGIAPAFSPWTQREQSRCFASQKSEHFLSGINNIANL